MSKIFYINNNDFHNLDRSQMCAGACYVFRTSKPHSRTLCIVNIICSQSRFPLPQPSQGSWRILGHEADKDTFVDSLHLQSNLVIFILAEHDLERSVLGEHLINVIIQNSSRLNFLTNGRPTSPHTQIYETKLKYFPSSQNIF